MSSQETIQQGKTLAIVSYFTFVGLLIAIILNLEKKNPFTSFHIRQMFGLIIMLIVSNVTEKYIDSWLGTIFWIITFVSWLYGLFYALQGKYKEIPYLGSKFQEWFRNIN
ncbi:MAG: hypothetical protein L3J25_02400 [Flavobacteriaceae bacterium]|nr:hypothetical protein [Flavobacteriaceae bacterium]